MVSRKYIVTLLLLLSSILLRAQLLPTYGEERAGLSAFTFLKLSIDPASVATGGASLSMTEHSIGALSNPALISGGDQQGFSSANRQLGGGIAQDFFSVSKARKTGQYLTFTANSLNTGSILERTVWQPEGTGREIYSSLNAFGLGISQAFSEYFNAGVQLKYGHEQLGIYSAHNVYLDMGFLYKLDISDLQFAAALTNFGPNTPLSNLPAGEESALAATPQMFSMGIQWTAWSQGDQKLTPSFQLNHPTDNAEFYAAGLKYSTRSFYAGVGYQIGSQKAMPWFGFGSKTQLRGWPMELGIGAMPTPYNTYQGTFGIKITPLGWYGN
jgi:hypothetical protein